jgi:Lrp/AsnC family transcriptional regulator, leucine-responsive regulatory protein
MLEELDISILQILQSNARISNAELARRINLSPPATLARVRRLEESGYIDGYAAFVNHRQAGYDMLCFVSVSLQLHDIEQVTGFRNVVRKIPEVLECHHVTGDYDYLLKIVARNTQDLENFLLRKLTPIPGVARIHTSLVLNEVKSTTVIPIK